MMVKMVLLGVGHDWDGNDGIGCVCARMGSAWFCGGGHRCDENGFV